MEETKISASVQGANAREAMLKMGINMRTFNKCIEDGSKLVDPVNLFKGLWYEGELTALYADTNVGKSILAVQIADEVARKGIPTMYVDLELSDKGIEKRARCEDGSAYTFSPNLHRLTLDFSRIAENDIDIDDGGMSILTLIELAGEQAGVKAIIIDNITAICSGVETGEVAVKLVNRLLSMRNDHGWSILFLAHTPKLDKTQPITRDSMAGSKRVISLVDSAFAIGEPVSTKDPSLRYVKQTKVRLDECRYHANNVMVCRIERVDGLLRFVEIGTAPESKFLTTKQDSNEINRILTEMSSRGLSQEQIAHELGLTRRQVQYRMNLAGITAAKNRLNEQKEEVQPLFNATA